MSFKSNVLPLLLQIIEKSENHDLRVKALQVLVLVIPQVDQNYIKDHIFVALEKVRQSSNDTELNMLLLSLYDKLASALTPEDIGQKILPSLIPMLISASLSKAQFKKLVSTIRTLIDTIEKHREKDLSEIE